MAIQSLFPSFILKAPLKLPKVSVAKVNRELIEEIYKIREIDDRGQVWSEKHYPGGYTSYASMNELHRFSSTFADLQKQIDLHVRQFTRHLQMDLHGRKLMMTTFWANIMPPQVVHAMHIHPLSVVSGTYYVQTPKNCSALKFEDPRLGFMMASPPRTAKARPENQRFISIEPKAGDLILFESWMRHEVPPNSAREERISVSFNYDWI
jgi:uncharacterized protein (TIGR02466 family)